MIAQWKNWYFSRLQWKYISLIELNQLYTQTQYNDAIFVIILNHTLKVLVQLGVMKKKKNEK